MCDECEWTWRKRLCITALVLFSVGALVVGLSLGLTLKWKVLWRCERYKGWHPEISEIDCQKVWTAFEEAYVGRDPCNVPMGNYGNLISTFRPAVKCDETLFWSETKDLALAFTAKNKCKMTLQETLLGYMMDDLTWCSGKDSDKTSKHGCPQNCENNPVDSFWRQLSSNFAASTCGYASVLLSASAERPYNQSSDFGRFEVPNLNSGKVNRLTAYLVTDGTTTGCSHPSLQTLRDDLKNVAFSCEEITSSDLQQCISDPKKPCLGC